VGVKRGFGEDIFDPSPGQVSGPLIRFLDHVYKTASGDVFSIISVHEIPIFFPAMFKLFKCRALPALIKETLSGFA
jgi:hypothetical protein